MALSCSLYLNYTALLSVLKTTKLFLTSGFQKAIFFGTPITLSFPWINPIHLVSLILNVISSERPSLNPRPNQIPWYTLKWHPAVFLCIICKSLCLLVWMRIKPVNLAEMGLLCSRHSTVQSPSMVLHQTQNMGQTLYSKTLKAGHNSALGFHRKAPRG